jgi:glycerophosphoryl diester phosphodiesterase
MTQTKLHPFLDHPRPTGIAHRGGSLEAEENTLPAFEHALSLGYSHVELDVHATCDGVVVVHHDPTADRMFADPREIAQMTWAEVSALRSAAGASVPRLDELLSTFPQLFINIEAKSDDVIEPLAKVLRRADALRRVCVGSFVPERTQGLRRLLGSGLCWSPAHRGVAALWALGWGLPAGQIDFPVVQVPTHWKGVPVITRRFVKAAHARGILVQVWTVDDGAEMKRLIDLGVDAIMTDRPTLLREVLQRRGMWNAELARRQDRA